MKNPLPLPVERAIGVGVVIALFWLWWGSLLARAKESSAADVKIHAADSSARAARLASAWWQAKYQIAADSIGRLNTTVGRLLTADAGDTVWRHDSILVHGEPRIAIPLPTLARLDSTRRACGAIVSSVVPLRTSCDSSLAAAHRETAATRAWGEGWHQKYQADHPRWYDRCGLAAGYAAVESQGVIRAGPALTIGCRLLP